MNDGDDKCISCDSLICCCEPLVTTPFDPDAARDRAMQWAYNDGGEPSPHWSGRDRE